MCLRWVLVILCGLLWVATPQPSRAQEALPHWYPLAGPAGRISHLATAPGGALYAVSITSVNRRDDQTQWRETGSLIQSQALYGSEDGGVTWQPVTNDLPPGQFTALAGGGSHGAILVGLLGIYFNSAPAGGNLTFNILEISKVTIPITAQRIFFPLTFVGFGVLGALFPFHTWSPDGHASAPTAVSMLHAGVLMKLGGYGAFRVAIFLMPQAAHELSWIFIILTSISVVYGAFGAIVQKDLKYINAYSSVSHCGLVLFAVLMMNQTAMNGAIIQMISHGLMTALFFALIGMLYGRTHTRLINEMGGLMKVIPFLSVCYVIAGLASLGLPGLSGFVAEMTIFVGAFQHPEPFYRVVTILAVSSIVITAVYILRVVAQLLLGPTTNKHYEHLTDAKWFEKVSVVTLISSVAAIGLAPYWLSSMIGVSLHPIVQKIIAISPF